MVLKLPPARKVILPNSGVPRVQAPARTLAKPAPAISFSHGDGFATARGINEQRDREKELQKNRPFDFYMKNHEGGTNGVTIILTDKVRIGGTQPYFHYMHRWGFEEKDVKVEVCLQDSPEGCPLCRSLNKKGGYEMALTCIDTRPYTPKSGANANKTIPRSKRPYNVKISMIPVFERLYKQHKTFRGMVLQLFRDGAKSAGTGSTVQFIKMLSEAELAKYGELAVPLDYSKAYPRLTAAKMAEIYGIDGALGGGGGVGAEDFGVANNDELPF